MTVINDFNEAINSLAELNHSIDIYTDDWDILPTAVKNTIKTRAVGIINEQITALNNVITQINNL